MENLVGKTMPNVAISGTNGAIVNPLHEEGWAVYFCYPYTGRPGISDPPDWDVIKGAHGSTSQAHAYSNTYDAFRILNIKIYGVSFQDTLWQKEFVNRQALRVPLLSDVDHHFSHALSLPTFSAGDQKYLTRLTLIVKNGNIRHVRFPIEDARKDADEVLRWFANEIKTT
jgi:peroxiredoxin